MVGLAVSDDMESASTSHDNSNCVRFRSPQSPTDKELDSVSGARPPNPSLASILDCPNH